MGETMSAETKTAEEDNDGGAVEVEVEADPNNQQHNEEEEKDSTDNKNSNKKLKKMHSTEYEFVENGSALRRSTRLSSTTSTGAAVDAAAAQAAASTTTAPPPIKLTRSFLARIPPAPADDFWYKRDKPYRSKSYAAKRAKLNEQDEIDEDLEEERIWLRPINQCRCMCWSCTLTCGTYLCLFGIIGAIIFAIVLILRRNLEETGSIIVPPEFVQKIINATQTAPEDRESPVSGIGGGSGGGGEGGGGLGFGKIGEDLDVIFEFSGVELCRRLSFSTIIFFMLAAELFVKF